MAVSLWPHFLAVERHIREQSAEGAGIAGEVKGASHRDRPTDGLEAKPGQLYFKLERWI